VNLPAPGKFYLSLTGGRVRMSCLQTCWQLDDNLLRPSSEKEVRRWFVEQDLVEGVIYLPGNPFYNTTSPGTLLILNKNKAKDRRGKLFLIHASQIVEKGDPKNFIPPVRIERIATVFNAWQEVEKFAKAVAREHFSEGALQHLPVPLHQRRRRRDAPASAAEARIRFGSI
jgi:hypothetical protein